MIEPEFRLMSKAEVWVSPAQVWGVLRDVGYLWDHCRFGDSRDRGLLHRDEKGARYESGCDGYLATV
jgi:hypothetical protein